METDFPLRFTGSCNSPKSSAPYHKNASYTRACNALPSTNLSFTMRSWTIAERSNRLTMSEPGTMTPGKSASLDPDLEDAVREYLRTYVVWRGIRQATATFGVSRHTLWRFLRRDHTGRALPRAPSWASWATAWRSWKRQHGLSWPPNVCLLAGQLPNPPGHPIPCPGHWRTPCSCCAPRPWPPWTSCPASAESPLPPSATG